MQLWNNNKNDGKASRIKEEYDSFLKDEEVIKALNKIRMQYSDLLKKLMENNNE
jgi:hypothetical protein